ncbi:hypothetical protein EWM64_g3290 [Hericium alpestre]|uniref:Uncharacterized protein n=1 Tax=Hericium alpestre TaxID=135208 RepID=A0A4Z0A3B0_9AGAM|nr:hypothetical protein EWM64_g3290 [Hericium alpestre]
MPLADLLLQYAPLPSVPYHLTHYVPGATPMSTQPVVLGTLVGYLVVIFGIQAIMMNRSPLKLTLLFQVHNVILSAGSTLLLALMLEEILPKVWSHGVFYAICNPAVWTERMEFYYMINYSFKYLELLDTIFLALKKKPLAFLHVFHHSATALLCYTQLNGRTSISWVVITLNLAVHVLMYYYYYATAGGAKIWWKKYLTTMQIVQFIIDLFVVYFGTYSYFAASYWPNLPSVGSCAGTESAALFGCGLLTSYLFLFINFYVQTYRKPAKGKKPIANGNGHINGDAYKKEPQLGKRRADLQLILMDDVWEQTESMRSPKPREFFVSVELYISGKAAAALRKPLPRKKPEKRDGSRPLSILTDDGQRKVKEKTSWLNLARGPSAGDHWRQATCRLLEEGEGCLLNVYIDETILFQSVYVHLLNQTDVRYADRSLFFRKDCMGIHCAAGQRWSAISTTEPLYFYFASTELLNAWTALLRSYAVPEVYGRGLSPEGGLYRIWRQIELTCMQGRNIGTQRTFSEPATPASTPAGDQELHGEGDAVDWDLFCEVYLNNTLFGRTIVKKSLGAPDWHENFTFSDLPAFEKLAIILWRERKLAKPALIGTMYITLTNFRRGECVEGWFPLLQGGAAAASIQVGQIRLKLKVDEEIVLPYAAYSGIVDTLHTRNYLDWMSDFELKLKLKHISSELVAIAVAEDSLLDNVFQIADREVDGTPSSHNTLFRGNNMFTKTVELLMAWYGKAFLEASVGSTIRRLCAENVTIEVDPVRSGKSVKDIERNVDVLVYWCQEMWNQIYSVRAECPNEMRLLFEHIRLLVEKRYRIQRDTPDKARELPWQSVSAFCFLRFIVPAILHPHLFGLCPGLPELPSSAASL